MPRADRTVRIVRPTGSLEAIVETDGDISERLWERAVRQLTSVTEDIDDKVLFAKVKLRIAPGPARAQLASVEITIDINGDLVRAHAAARSLDEAVAIAQTRLRDKLQHRAQRRIWRRTRASEQQPGQWRHGDAGTHRPDYFDRPVADRELIRHKSFAVDELTPDEAAFDMLQLDYDFYLFRDLATGQDALLKRGSGDTFQLSLLNPSAADPDATAVKLEISDTVAPHLATAEAIERVEASGERLVFFANTTTGRGNVVYHRFDGHYGLITLE